MNTNTELYEFVHELVDDLREINENDRAQKIESALYVSTVPGEIIGQLRIELNEFVKDSVVSGLSNRDRIREAILYLDNVLG